VERVFFKALLSRESSKLVSARRVHLVLGTSCILSCGTETVFKATSCGSEARLLVLLFEKEDPGPCRVMFMSGSKSCRYTEVVHYRLLVSPGRLPKSANVRSRNCRSTYVAWLWSRKLSKRRSDTSSTHRGSIIINDRFQHRLERAFVGRIEASSEATEIWPLWIFKNVCRRPLAVAQLPIVEGSSAATTGVTPRG
jgi:hypothetical protein